MNKIVLLGEGGAGKTTTAKKLIGEIKSDTTIVLESMCYVESTPYSMFHQLLDSFLDIDLFGKRETNDAVDQALAIASGFFLGPIAGFMDGNNKEGFSKQDIFVSIKEKFITLNKNKDIIIFIDDLQWVDNASKELLKYILEEFSNYEKFTFIATCRPSDDNSLLNYLNLENDIQHINGLNKEEQLMFLKNTFFMSNDVSEWIINWISDSPTVYPFAIVDIVANLYKNNVLQKSEYGYIFSKEFDKEDPIIPDNIKNEILDIINKFPEYKDILGVCATYGKEFDVVLISNALDINILKFTQILDELSEKTGLIYDLLSKDNIYTFKSQIALDALRNIIGFSTKSCLDNSIPQVIRYYHQIIAQAMENAGLSVVGTANHYYASSKTSVKKAITFLLKASEFCKEIYQFEDAIDFINKARELSILDNSFEDKINEKELLILAEKEFVTGNPTIELTEKLIKYLSAIERTDELKIVTARSCYDSGRLDRIYFQKCVEISKKYLIISANDIVKAEGLHFAAIGMDNTPENKSIKIKYFEDALELSKTDKMIYSKIANSYAGYLSFGTDDEKMKAFELFNQSKNIKENLEIRDLPGLARTYGGLGRLALFSEDDSKLNEALENFKEDLEISKDLEDAYGISNMYSFIGTTYKKMKNFLKAVEFYDKSIELQHNKIDYYISSLGKIEAFVMLKEFEKIDSVIADINQKKKIFGDIPPFVVVDIKKLLKNDNFSYILKSLDI